MGIPRFVRTLISRYPLILKNIIDKKELPETDFFYIDLRHIIHEVSHGDKENILFLIKFKSFSEMYEEICMAIGALIDTVHPKKFVMIADDGVCPLAKLPEIIKRRFLGGSAPKSIYNFLISIGIEPKQINLFEKDLISCGTNFMWDLGQYIMEFIKNKQKNDIYWQSLDIVYSGSNCEGEGEHKIISHIRQYQKSEQYKEQTKYCIYSNDGDMILLSLLVHEPNIIILQEDNVSSHEDKNYLHEFTEEHMFVINNQVIMISVLREYLDIEFKDYFTKENTISFEYNINRIFDDLVLLCLLFGNDFIPGLTCLDKDGRIFEYLLMAYKESLPKCDNYFVHNTIINYNNLKEFFIEFSKFEKDILNLKLNELKIHYSILKNKKTYSAFKHYGDTMNEMAKKTETTPTKFEVLEEALNHNQNFVKALINGYENENKIRLIENDVPYEKLFFVEFMDEYNKGDENIDNAKDKYYKKKLGNKKISEFFFAYLAGIQWIYFYYCNGISNYNWMYKYHYVPFISDLANYDIEENFNKLVNKKVIDLDSKPLSSYALSCLSFSENAFNELLPKEFSKAKKVLNNFNKEINKSKFDLNGEIFVRNAYVLQPFLSQKQLNDLNKCINEIYNKLDEKYKIMNTQKKSIVFHKNELLLEDNDSEFIIDIINSVIVKFSNNTSNEEKRSNFNFFLVNSKRELFNKYLPKIEEGQVELYLQKINKIFEIFISYNINIEDYDIDINFNKSLMEQANYNNNLYTDIIKYNDIEYPSINYLTYNYNEEETIQILGKKYKFTKLTKSIKINIFSKYKNIIEKINNNELIETILNEKIIIYGYPIKKIGIIEGIIYKGKYYFLKDEKIEESFKTINQMEKYPSLDYENSNIIIKIKGNIKYEKDKTKKTIQRIKIINIDEELKDIVKKEYIPIELTSLNILKEDENCTSIIKEINELKIFYEKNQTKDELENNEIELKFKCCFFQELIINVKYEEKLIDIEKRIIKEKKELENKQLIFLCNAIKIDKLKTVKENNLFSDSIIAIFPKDEEQKKEEKKEEIIVEEKKEEEKQGEEEEEKEIHIDDI